MAKKTTTKDEMLDLANRQTQALLDADMAALDEQTAREQADQDQREKLNLAQQAEAGALNAYNKAQYNNMGQILSTIEDNISKAKEKDETARRRENAFRYISGLGDTLSSVANLVGTAHGAANQNQTYNSHAVVQKAEQARKARKLEMDDLNKRLEEMQARQRELQASGNLEEAKLKVNQAKEMAALESNQRKAAEEAKRYADTQSYRAMRDAHADWDADRRFNAQQEQWEKNYNMQYAKFKEEQKGNNYNFTFSDGSIDVPKEKLNEVNVERIFQMLPEELRKNVKGKATTEYVTDEFGNQIRQTGHEAPSLAQKLAAIGAYAESDQNIKNEIRNLAGLSKLAVATPQAQTLPEENAYLNSLGTLSMNPQFGQTTNGKKTIKGW